MAVIKADAYGHGAVAAARALGSMADVLAVSLVEEGVELREAGIDAPILVMGPALAGGHDEIVARDMTAMVSDLSDLEALADIGRARGAPVPIHLKLDTGMGRLGLMPGQIAAVPDGVTVVALATHLACADTDDPADPTCMTLRQLALFDELTEVARRCGIDPPARHAANSAAALAFPRARLSAIRPGLALYGNAADAQLRGAMRLVTQIAQLRDVPARTTVSYGALWRAERASRLAVLPVGYADGFPRLLTGKADALVGGQRCPVVGAICMDVSVVDVTSLGDAAAVGDEVVLLGAQGRERITATELAARSGLIEYEVTCGISKRVPRIYLP
jgi:alanine racemase